jgi:predicted glycosyltransferase
LTGYTGNIEHTNRFLFYSHDGLGLGHVRRNLSVASALVELAPDASVLIATSAEEAESFGIPPSVDLLKLPGLRKIGNDDYAARRLQMSWEEIRLVRSELLAAAVDSFRPSVLLSDKHPLGVGGELTLALKIAHAAGSRAVLGLRDVLDDPAAVRLEWSNGGMLERIPEEYDRVLVYGQPEVFDPRREYAFPDAIAAITRFCGYVVSPGSTALPDGDRQQVPHGATHGVNGGPLVLATAGGGEDGFALLATFVEAATLTGWEAVVVSGPHSDPSRTLRLRTLAGEAGVAFRRFVPGFASEFSAFDALVCMGGYNTLAEAAASGVPTVCVPRVRPRTEQLIRAQVFARQGLLRLLEPDRLDAATLGTEVEWVLAEAENGRSNPLDLGGAQHAAGHLLELAAAAPTRLAASAGVR